MDELIDKKTDRLKIWWKERKGGKMEWDRT